MSRDLEVIQEFDTYYNEAYYAWDAFYPLADRDLRFYLGDQWDEQEKRQLFQEGRSTFVFNRVRRNINLVCGYQRKHRLSSVVVPQEESDQLLADQLTKLLLHVFNKADVYECISNCFGGALKTGWNLLSLWMDYREDPINGDIAVSREPYNSFILDPYFTNLDFSDCGYILRRKYLNVDQCASLLPDMKKDIYGLWKVGWSRDDKFTWLPYQRQPDGQELLAYNEMYLQKWKNVPVLVDTETGELTEFDFDRETIRMFRESYPQLEVIERPKRYIEKHIIINDHYMKTEINPYGLDEYPFVPFTAIFEPESDQWGLKVQSLIRCMVDPQREANRRRSQMIDILDSQINSGWIANENSVINPRSLFQSSQGKVIWRREDAPPGALEKIPPAQIPPSMFQLQELFDNDMVEIAGINDAAFGAPDSGQESGVMMMLRQGAAVVNLQELFDNLRFAQENVSRKIIKMMQQWKPNKFQRILNEQPDPKLFDTEMVKYDINVQEGVLTDTQRQMYFRQLVDLRQLGAPVSGEMLAKAAPIQGKSEYIKELAQMEQQQAQAAQQAEQVQQAVLQSQLEYNKSSSIEKIAGAKERFTRAVANMGLEDSRASQAVQDRADAALSRTKAMKELQEMDDNRLVKYLGIIRLMEEINQREENQVKRDDVTVSAQGEAVAALAQQKNPMSPGMGQQEQVSLEVSDEEARI